MSLKIAPQLQLLMAVLNGLDQQASRQPMEQNVDTDLYELPDYVAALVVESGASGTDTYRLAQLGLREISDDDPEAKRFKVALLMYAGEQEKLLLNMEVQILSEPLAILAAGQTLTQAIYDFMKTGERPPVEWLHKTLQA